MLSFIETDQVTLSMWLQAHAQEPRQFLCNSQWHRYFLVDDVFNPDMGICFGYDDANNTYFISDNVPANIRTDILRIEHRRLTNPAHEKKHSYAVALFFNGMPASRSKRLLVRTLTTFYENLCMYYEHGAETLESRDAHAALTYLRSL